MTHGQEIIGNELIGKAVQITQFLNTQNTHGKRDEPFRTSDCKLRARGGIACSTRHKKSGGKNGYNRFVGNGRFIWCTDTEMSLKIVKPANTVSIDKNLRRGFYLVLFFKCGGSFRCLKVIIFHLIPMTF